MEDLSNIQLDSIKCQVAMITYQLLIHALVLLIYQLIVANKKWADY